jgi:GTP-binding protein
MVPTDAEDPQSVLDQLRTELAAYSADLASRPYWIGLSKADLLPAGEDPPKLVAEGALGVHVFSAVTRHGLEALIESLWTSSRKAAREDSADEDLEW